MQTPVALTQLQHTVEACWVSLHSPAPTQSAGCQPLRDSVSSTCPLALHTHSIHEHFIRILILYIFFRWQGHKGSPMGVVDIEGSGFIEDGLSDMKL